MDPGLEVTPVGTREGDLGPARNHCMLFLRVQMALWRLGHRGGSAIPRVALWH